MTENVRPRPLLRTVVGETLRRHRQEQRRTLAEVAREAAVSVQYLSEVERGRKEPSSEILAAVCEALGVELSELVVEVGHELAFDRVPADVVRLRLATITSIAPATRAAPPIHRTGDAMLMAA
ncbi:helix-turn-helix domain-containing protein [Paractinoplanes rhizophilus]|jgi:transcriptional regulator with XRE-family HTH domain|uniref:Helix-turn-helix domain-containing protein n=1 Tax=Paractinoplanes rhizophilus TaxID=1416877 RepID=A0ABW2I5H3_9ACTN|nr:helix-turn-helix transcriptional regulator [Actinoplanes sp.]